MNDRSTPRKSAREEFSNRNVLKMAIAIVVGVGMCWVPWSIIESLMAFTGDSGFSCGFHIYRAIAWVIADAYCAICFEIIAKVLRDCLNDLERCRFDFKSHLPRSKKSTRNKVFSAQRVQCFHDRLNKIFKEG